MKPIQYYRYGFSLIAIVATLAMSFVFTLPSQARQFRSVNPILSPGNKANTALQLPAGAVPVAQAQPVSGEAIKPLIRKVLEQWNTGTMAETLSQQFHDRDRLLDVMNTGVPRDAKLRVQSIQGIQTLQQFIRPGQGGERDVLVSIVSATVKTQLEFNSSSGFTRLPGTNEFILEVTQATPP